MSNAAHIQHSQSVSLIIHAAKTEIFPMKIEFMCRVRNVYLGKTEIRFY